MRLLTSSDERVWLAEAGHSFAHYAATSFRKVRDQLNLTIGVRPWEEEAPGPCQYRKSDLW